MKIQSLLASIVCLLPIACGQLQKSPSQESPSTEVKYDSAHSIALDAEIANGVIYSNTDFESSLIAGIKEQLRYTIGQFNGENAVGDLNGLKIEIKQIEEDLSGEYAYKVTYSATYIVAWPRNAEEIYPDSYQLVLPKSANSNLLSVFVAKIGENDLNCLDSHAHNVTTGIAWYYYRPQNCSQNLIETNSDLLSVFPINFAVSGENTEGKYPEYDLVWEDDVLSATLIFGKAEEGATSIWDAGIAAYNETYQQLVTFFGEPVESNLDASILFPGNANPELNLVFNKDGKVVKINMFLIDGIRSVGEGFKEKYNNLTEISDYVSYSGHSGLGANIRALAEMGRFVQGKYQLFLVNGCDTFAYVDSSLKDAHSNANQGESESKYFDLITNAMPSYFHMNAEANMAVVKALFGQVKTYREMLAEFDIDQRALVSGEEDNTFQPESL